MLAGGARTTRATACEASVARGAPAHCPTTEAASPSSACPRRTPVPTVHSHATLERAPSTLRPLPLPSCAGACARRRMPGRTWVMQRIRSPDHVAARESGARARCPSPLRHSCTTTEHAGESRLHPRECGFDATGPARGRRCPDQNESRWGVPTESLPRAPHCRVQRQSTAMRQAPAGASRSRAPHGSAPRIRAGRLADQHHAASCRLD